MSARRRIGQRPVRMLYLMHSDWNLVWQRPQALATSLHRGHGFRLLVAYLPSFRRWNLIRNASPIRRLPLPQLPFARRSALVRRLNRGLARAALTVIAWIQPADVVLVPYPSLHAALPERLRRLPIVYDCMDLAVGFHPKAETRDELAMQERALLAEASLVFVSSDYLHRHVEPLMGGGRRAILLRNGFDAAFGAADAPAAVTGRTGGNVRLGYFGMISSWFDQAAVRACLEAVPELEIHLWGPHDVALTAHPRLHAHGGVPHDRLPAATAGMDAMIMPFVVSDLIEGVDPVKLYEYLSLGRPVISVHYPELDHFAGLVHFYHSRDELVALVRRLADGDSTLQPDRAAVAEFLRGSTWEVRAAVMAEAIRAMLAGPAPHP